MKQITLYFGSSRENDDPISKEDFKAFMKQYIYPSFQDFTFTIGSGYWEGEQEQVFIITIMTKEDVNFILSNIGDKYCNFYQQKCVLKTEFTINSILLKEISK